jgi:glycogen synthase
VDLLTSGIFAADHVNTVSPKFLSEVVDGLHSHIPGHIRHELWAKCQAGCATGILNAPDASFSPVSDPYLEDHYSTETVSAGKRANKIRLQRELGLRYAPDSPLLFWPSRLDPVQKGCHLLTDLLHEVTRTYEGDLLQIAVIASGAHQRYFHEIVALHGLEGRVAVCDFDERLSHLGYAAADFVLMPSSFEPCGLPQMIAPKYGALTIAHNTGGLHDTVEPLDVAANHGNGFRFDIFDVEGLRWAIDQAVRFFRQPAAEKEEQIQRVMREAKGRFNYGVTAAEYIRTYEKILGRDVCGLPLPAGEED